MKKYNDAIPEQNRTEHNRTRLMPRSLFIAGFLLLGSLLLSALALPLVFAESTDEKNLPELGSPVANTDSVQPNINAQGAGFTYQDNIDGKQIIITPQYNQQNGAAIGGSLAGALTKNMAVGVLLSVGSDKNEWLLNTGFDLTSKQRFIFSLGQLRQKLDFNFISGRQKTQIRQDNGAVSYQYFLGKNFLNAAEVNGYISDTGSVTLGDKTYFTDTISLYELWSDPRRIAGGRVSGVQGRLVFTPTSKTTIKVGLGAERLTYDYLTGNESSTRATGSAELVQRLDNNFNFRASANAAASQNRYALGLGKSFTGGSQLGLDVVTIQGRDNTFNDNQVMLSYTQSLGGNASTYGGSPVGMNNPALNNLDAAGASMNPAPNNMAAPNSTVTHWASSLVDQVARRPSFLPAQVIAKIDPTATPKRLIAIDKTAVPTGSSIDTATGVITAPTGTPVSGIAGVTKNAVDFTNAGQFALSGTGLLVVNPKLIAPPAVGVTDTYVVTMNNSSDGGTTLATVVVSHGIVKIDSIVMSSGIITPILSGFSLSPASVTFGTTTMPIITAPTSASSGAISYAVTGGTSTTKAVISSTGVISAIGNVGTTLFTATQAADGNYASSSTTATLTVTSAMINTAAIVGVIAPVVGATPVTTEISGTGYTGTVAWSGSPSTFAYGIAYTATVTLTAMPGYTFTGVTANFFTVSGATATNPANSGVVSAKFPATALPSGYIYTAGISGGLIWAPITITHPWSLAQTTCAELSVAGITGNAKPSTDIPSPTTTWRQPTKDELVALHNVSVSSPVSGISPAAWPPAGWPLNWYTDGTWSSTANNNYHYVVYLRYGTSGFSFNFSLYNVSCVH